jgi:hypothetical protein
MKALASLIPAALAMSACVSTDSTITDELAGEIAADDLVDGKADAGAIDGSYTYYQIRADLRRCIRPGCGVGFFLERLNRTTTECGDGTVGAACYANDLDLRESGLTDDNYLDLVRFAEQGSFGELGARAIVRGRFDASTFIVTEAWLPVNDTPAEGVFTRVKDAGIRCAVAPCPSTQELGLNTSRSGLIVDVDFEPAALLDDATRDEIVGDMFTPAGVIIAGDRFTKTVNKREAKGRTATAVFRKIVTAAN